MYHFHINNLKKQEFRGPLKGGCVLQDALEPLIPSTAVQTTVTVKIWEKSAILRRNNMCTQFRNNHWAWKLLISAFHQRKSKKVIFLIVSALHSPAILGKKKTQTNQQNLLLFPTYLLHSRPVSYLYYWQPSFGYRDRLLFSFLLK